MVLLFRQHECVIFYFHTFTIITSKTIAFHFLIHKPQWPFSLPFSLFYSTPRDDLLQSRCRDPEGLQWLSCHFWLSKMILYCPSPGHYHYWEHMILFSHMGQLWKGVEKSFLPSAQVQTKIYCADFYIFFADFVT